MHAVARAGGGETLCNLSVGRTKRIVAEPDFDVRCRACDSVWRGQGRREKPPACVDKRAVYTPRFTFKDWEGQDMSWSRGNGFEDV